MNPSRSYAHPPRARVLGTAFMSILVALGACSTSPENAPHPRAGEESSSAGAQTAAGAGYVAGGASGGQPAATAGGASGLAGGGVAASGDSSGGASAVGGTAGASGSTSGTATPRYDAIYSGTPWHDDQGNIVNAHGANIIKDGDKYYLFGEGHTDGSNAFTAFNCYSSTDLRNWKFERAALTVQASGRLGPGRVGERVKVMKCPTTGEYVMFMHTDNLKYTDQAVGYATSPTITGPYTFKEALQFDGHDIALWDLGAFQDTNGDGYVLLNGGEVYQLASDYHSASRRVVSGVSPGGESPSLFRADSTYFFLFSNKTSWERNDNYYFTATSMSGPWTSRGKFTPSGTLTWNSQTTFVLPVSGSNGTTYMFMGDRWSYPRQGSAATYVWQPLTVSGTSLSIPTFYEAWALDPSTGSSAPTAASGTSIDDKASGNGLNQLEYEGDWTHTSGGGFDDSESRAVAAGDSVSIRFTGTRIKLYGVATKDSGYATVTITDANGASVAAGTVDFYSNYRDTKNELKYVSPLLTSGGYSLKLSVVGDHGVWSDKAGTIFGSTANYVSVDRVVISEGP
jgi:hypothetical protein